MVKKNGNDINALVSKVQDDFVATKMANPELSDDQIIKRFPELSEFKRIYKVEESQSLEYLNSYYDAASSGNYDNLESLKSDFTIDKFRSKISPVKKGGSSNSTFDLVDKAQDDFVATLQANPDLSDEQLIKKFPEVSSFPFPDNQKALQYLKDYNSAALSGEYNDLSSLKDAFSLKKKESTTENLGGSTSTPQDPLSQNPLDQQSQLNLGGSTSGLDQLNSGSLNQIPEQPQLNQIPEQPQLTPSVEAEPIQNKQLGTDTIIGQDNLMVNPQTGFGIDQELPEAPIQVTDEDEKSFRETQIQVQDIEKASLIKSLAAQYGMEEDLVANNIDEWALKHWIEDPNGESLLDSDNSKSIKMGLRANLADKKIKEEADTIKNDYIKQATKIAGGDKEKGAAIYKKKANDVAFDFLSESDLDIKRSKEQISELENKEDRTIDDDIKLKQLKKKFQMAVDEGFVGSGDLYDPNTGSFVSGNKQTPKEVTEFNEAVREKVKLYENTDLGKLENIRDNAYFEYVAMNDRFKEFDGATQKLQQYKGDSYEEIQDLTAKSQVQTKYERKKNEALQTFMAVNKALLLNEDPGTVKEQGFFSSVGESLKEASFGSEVATNIPRMADRVIQEFESEGISITEDQADKLDKSLTQKIGNTIGTSIPISAEIAAQLFIGNKVAGALRIPMLAQKIAKGNKAAQLGINLLYEGGMNYAAFKGAGLEGSAGVGEGIGQVLGSVMLRKLGVKNKIANIIVRAGTGATVETMAEYSGQFFEEMSKNGMDLQKATEATFGKTAEEGLEKLIITATTALIMGAGGSVQESQLFNTINSEIENTNASGPIVDAYKELKITEPVSESESKQANEIEAKSKESPEEVTEEEVTTLERIKTREEFQKNKDKDIKEEGAPLVFDNEGDTEYKFNEGDGLKFSKESEILEKLEDEAFIEKIKSREIELELNNPSEEVKQKLLEIFPEVSEDAQLEINFPDYKEGADSDVEVNSDTEITEDKETPTNIEESITEPTSATETESILVSEGDPIITDNNESGIPITSGESNVSPTNKPTNEPTNEPISEVISESSNEKQLAESDTLSTDDINTETGSVSVDTNLNEDTSITIESPASISTDSKIESSNNEKVDDIESSTKKVSPFNPSIDKESISKPKSSTERLIKQSSISKESKKALKSSGLNDVTNQEKLYSDTKSWFDSNTSKDGSNISEILSVADEAGTSPDVREMMYAHAMQEFSELEKSSDPNISEMATQEIVRLGAIIAERTTGSGKQIKSLETIYKKFPMYAFQARASQVNKFAKRKAVKGSKDHKKASKESNDVVKNVLNDINNNLGEYLSKDSISSLIKDITKKIDSKKRYSKTLTKKRRAVLDAKLKAAKNKFIGKSNKLQSGIPGGEQLVALLEMASVYIELGMYRSIDIYKELRSDTKGMLDKVTDKELRNSLSSIKEFRDIINSEKESIKKDGIEEILLPLIKGYLEESLSLTGKNIKTAVRLSAAQKSKIKNDFSESLESNFDLNEKESKSLMDTIDLIFREATAKELRKTVESQYPKVSVKKAVVKRRIDRLVEDSNLGVFDATMEIADLTFKKYGLLNVGDSKLMSEIKVLSDKISNSKGDSLKNKWTTELETLIHKATDGYGMSDYLITRLYTHILSGPITHLKNFKFNAVAIGFAGPMSQALKGQNPLMGYKEMIRSFRKVDRKVAAHNLLTGHDYSKDGPNSYIDQAEFNLIKNGWTKFLNLASTRLLTSADLVMTRPMQSMVFKNYVKSFLYEESGRKLKGVKLEREASKRMGYTESNMEKSSKDAYSDVLESYGFNPFADDVDVSVSKEAEILLLLRTQERILENSGVISEMESDGSWLDKWNGESLSQSSEKEAKNLALQGEVTGFVGVINGLIQDILGLVPALRYKIPFTNIVGNMINMGIKATPIVGQAQAILRNSINSKLSKEGKDTISSSSLHLLSKVITNDKFKKAIIDKQQKTYSKRQSSRDLKVSAFTLFAQAAIYSLIKGEDDDEGLVITGQMTDNFFDRGMISDGTGFKPWTIYWQSGDKTYEMSEYKNSAYGYLFSFWGSVSDKTNIQNKDATILEYAESLANAPFFVSDKSTAASFKEIIDMMSVYDKYGNNKFSSGNKYKDNTELMLTNMLSTMTVANLLKQGTKITEQVYGMPAKRSTTWSQNLLKGVPFMNQEHLDNQTDHFGRTVEQKLDLGFLGVEGNSEEGFRFLDVEKVDPLYELYTEVAYKPKWFSDKNIDIYREGDDGYTRKKFAGSNNYEKMKISKSDGGLINRLLGDIRKEMIDEVVEYSSESFTFVEGVKALKSLKGDSRVNKLRSIETEAKKRAVETYFRDYYDGEIVVQNETEDKVLNTTNK